MNSFFKYSGSGNDFILFEEVIPLPVPLLCHRKRGIGADGVLLLQRKSRSHFQMRIFNADGSEAAMCGNGLRVFFSHLFSRYGEEAPFKVDSLHKTHTGWRAPDGEIEIDMGEAKMLKKMSPFSSFACDLFDTGVPHLVLERTPLSHPFIDIAPHLRSHPLLPEGANVNLIEKIDDEWKVTTYERGVEGITEACGTGVTAAALSLACHEGLISPITLLTPGGDRLTVAFEGPPENPKRVTLKGKVSLIFEGTASSSIISL